MSVKEFLKSGRDTSVGEPTWLELGLKWLTGKPNEKVGAFSCLEDLTRTNATVGFTKQEENQKNTFQASGRAGKNSWKARRSKQSFFESAPATMSRRSWLESGFEGKLHVAVPGADRRGGQDDSSEA